MSSSSSELILNSDQSVYHLGLKKEHLTPLILSVGDPERVPKVSAHFDRVEHRIRRREFHAHIGWLADRKIMCISTGIGTDNMDIVIQELDALANIDFQTMQSIPSPHQLCFIRLGTCGTFQPDVQVGTMVVTHQVLGLDGLGPSYHFPSHPLEVGFRESYPQFGASAYASEADKGLLAAALKAGFTKANGMTCAGFYGPQRRQLRIAFAGPSLSELAAFRWSAPAGQQRIEVFEMETAGLYALSAALGHSALSIGVVLANRHQNRFSPNPEPAIEDMIEATIRMIKENPSTFWKAEGF